MVYDLPYPVVYPLAHIAMPPLAMVTATHIFNISSGSSDHRAGDMWSASAGSPSPAFMLARYTTTSMRM